MNLHSGHSPYSYIIKSYRDRSLLEMSLSRYLSLSAAVLLVFELLTLLGLCCWLDENPLLVFVKSSFDFSKIYRAVRLSSLSIDMTSVKMGKYSMASTFFNTWYALLRLICEFKALNLFKLSRKFWMTY